MKGVEAGTCDVGEMACHALIPEVGATKVNGAHAVVDLHLHIAKLDGIS